VHLYAHIHNRRTVEGHNIATQLANFISKP